MSTSDEVKAYWIARVDINDIDAYQVYVSAAKEAFEKHGAKFLARGGEFYAAEGKARARNVIIEFPSFEAARSCYNSPEYQNAKTHRTSISEAEIVIVKGYQS